MKRYLILVFILISVALGFVVFNVGVSPVHKSITTNDTIEVPFKSVAIAAFYFVPKDREDRISPQWKQDIESGLKQLQEFHTVQFSGQSNIVYSIYKEPVIGVLDGLDYDTENTARGNPSALRRVAIELENRFPLQDNELRVIIYEGVGASSSENVAFLSSTFLFQDSYKNSYGPTFLAHEFYHTLGIHNNYDNITGIASSNDIMGLGRFRQLKHTYLEYEIHEQ